MAIPAERPFGRGWLDGWDVVLVIRICIFQAGWPETSGHVVLQLVRRLRGQLVEEVGHLSSGVLGEGGLR